MMFDGPPREEEPLGDLLVVQPLGDHGQNLRFPAGEAGRVVLGGGTGAPGHAALPALAQAAGDPRGGRPGAEPLKLRERPSQGGRVLGLPQRERRLVGAPEVPPGLGRPLVVAGEVDREGLGDAGRGTARRSPPRGARGELPRHPGGVALERDTEGLCRGLGGEAPAGRRAPPPPFGRSRWARGAAVVAALGEGRRLGEQRPRVRVARRARTVASTVTVRILRSGAWCGWPRTNVAESAAAVQSPRSSSDRAR